MLKNRRSKTKVLPLHVADGIVAPYDMDIQYPCDHLGKELVTLWYDTPYE